MEAQAKAVARTRGYALIAELLVRGPAGARASALAAFAATPPAPDDVASQFVAAFDLGVPPYASVFGERDGCVGGEITRDAVDAMAADGYAPVTDDVAACHLGVLLAHAARLGRAGQDARAAAFVGAHVVGWLPPYLAALEALAAPFWVSVVSVALELAMDHAQARPGALQLGLDRTTEEPDLLGDDRGLRDVAVYLAYPARCGLFITDVDCTRIGRMLDLPRGFGTRRDRLETILRAAAEYDAMIPLCNALDGLASDRLRRVNSLTEGRSASSMSRPWRERTQRTRRMLKTLEAGAQTVSNPGRVAR